MNFLLDGQESKRLFLRKIRPDDFAEWLKFFENPATSKYWHFESEGAETDCRKWYERQFERYANDEGGMNALIEKTSGKLVGHCGLLKQVVDGIAEPEIAYSILPVFWNKGYASEAAIKCRDFAFEINYRHH